MSASVVRIGPFGDQRVSAKVLKDALLSYFEDVNAEESSLTISNKYFSAIVVLEPLTPAEDPRNDIESDKNNNSNNGRIEDGVILVFDHKNLTTGMATSFDSLATVHQQAQDADMCGDLLRLCVGVSPEAISVDDHDEAEYARRVLWCLDHGYEYVQADLSPAGQATGHDVRDKDGFARIVEAIRGTVWSTAVHHPRDGSSSIGVGAGNSKSNATSLLLGAMVKEEKDDNEPKNSPNAQSSQESNPDDDDGADRYEPPDPIKFNMASLIPTKVNNAGSPAPDTERVFDEMDALLKQATRIREDIKKGEMTDEERRQRAGDAAMALINLMGKFGMDEDEGDSSDNSLEDGS